VILTFYTLRCRCLASTTSTNKPSPSSIPWLIFLPTYSSPCSRRRLPLLSILRCMCVCSSVLQRVAIWCSVLQCLAVSCSCCSGPCSASNALVLAVAFAGCPTPLYILPHILTHDTIHIFLHPTPLLQRCTYSYSSWLGSTASTTKV